VVSPGTAAHHRREKQDAYQHAGVREYWVADPASQTVEVLALHDGIYHSQGVFEGDAILSTQVIPHFNISVRRFF
jgi:Uma2 family endonuclease